ncbi:TIGR04283 family arsenosugar biosynthesis glycosyltransferase [Leptothoe sp. PORK10 BA2]|uniref:TIGR04283 family arsenosugar biosynthesis glycosyltransferase n=1 Tax=Leptothoe sp. PORK10 BA2 TaxID=3110254 RepID=UPI003FA36A5D
MAQVSIIIPVLNEACCLGRTLRHLDILDPPAHEVMVVDGGSTDETVAIAQEWGAKVIFADRPSRAGQMNLGAQLATGDILCFLHGDTRVPDDVVMLMVTTLVNPAIACGGFISVMAGQHTTRWGISLHNSVKTHYAPLLFRPHRYFRDRLRILFGDQVMFCRRADFWDCGGFDERLSIMEDADLCLKLSRLGRIYQVNRLVQSSDRRVAKWGPLKANLIYLAIGFLWGMGVPGPWLKRFYADVR